MVLSDVDGKFHEEGHSVWLVDVSVVRQAMVDKTEEDQLIAIGPQVLLFVFESSPSECFCYHLQLFVRPLQQQVFPFPRLMEQKVA